MEFIEISAKTVDDAVIAACQQLSITSDKLEYEVVEEGKAGIFGFGAKPAIIKARAKATLQDLEKAV
jgi:spoIIIJ-associated protein